MHAIIILMVLIYTATLWTDHATTDHVITDKPGHAMADTEIDYAVSREMDHAIQTMHDRPRHKERERETMPCHVNDRLCHQETMQSRTTHIMIGHFTQASDR